MDGISEADLLKIHQMALEERQSTVTSLLNQQKLPEALAESLRKPPTGITDEKVKNDSADLVGEVLLQVKDAQIKQCVENLTPEQVDTLMKYIYKGLATYNNCNTYLKWHEQVKAVGGLGCIVRCLAERKSVLDTN
mmetsp:Transcript_25013/g.42768  ORF Transcript_25013/g.42768 Transcript_25013/m.42768 type:complete len:136 (-) Transcript_25013:127-534(-)